MNWKRHSLIFRMGFCLAFVLLNSLTNAQTRKSALVLLPENEILKSLKQYDNFILQNNADSIAAMFLPNGNLGNMAIGRDSIFKFLLKFKNIKVLATRTVSRQLISEGEAIHQLGQYTQTAVLPHGDTIRVKGKIDLWWSKNNHGIWALQKVLTAPTP